MSDIDKTRENTLAALAADYSTLIHIDSVTDNSGSHQGVVADGGLTDDLQPTLNGYLPGAEGLEIRVFLNGSVSGYATVGDDGKWSYTPETPLIAGTENWFQASLIDPANGNTQWLSNEYNLTTTEPNQDGGTPTTPPAAPDINSVVDDVPGGSTDALQNGGLTNDARPALSGHAEAGSTVKIYDNGVLLGTTTAATDGAWTFTPATALNDGTHSLTVTAANAAGESAATDFSIVVDTTIIKPVIDLIFDDSGSQQGTVVDGGLTDDSKPRITGTSEPGSTVTITMYGPVSHQTYTIASVKAGDDGTWTYQFSGTQALQTGNNVFHVVATDAAGNKSASDSYTVNLVGTNQDDIMAPDAPVITTVYDDVGVMQDNVVNGGKTDDDKLKLTGTAEAGSTVTISHTIQSTGQSYTDGSVVADANGHWTFQMVNGFQNTYANRIFTATATDTAGNTSAESTPYVVDYVRSNQDTNFSSGFENFENYAGQYWYNEFTTQSGLHFIGTDPNSSRESIGSFKNDSEDHGKFLTFSQGKADHLTVELPGIAKELSFDYTYASGREYVTLYDADGNQISSSRLDSLGTTDGGRTQTWHTFNFTAPGDSEIAYFTITQTDSYQNTRIYMDNIKWTSPDALEATQDYSMHVNQYDVTNNTHDTLQLTLTDILNEMHPNLFIQDGKQQLAVTGDAGDVVELKVEDIAHDWQDAGQVTAGGVQYEVYQHADLNVELLVQQGLELQQVS